MMFSAMFFDAWRQTRDQWIQWLLYAALAVLLATLAFFPVNWLIQVFFEDNALADLVSEADKAAIAWAGIKTIVIGSVGGFIGLVLSLIMTAGQIPAMLRPGSVDLLVSYPHARWKLLLARYLSGVVFVAWYGGLLIGGMYVIAGLRGGSWDPKFLLCLPALLLMYCTLYSIALVMAVFFRNTVMVILGTLGVWMLALVLNTAAGGFYGVSIRDYQRAESDHYRQSQKDWVRTQFFAQFLEASERSRRQQHRAAQGAGSNATPEQAPERPRQLRSREAMFADANWYEGVGDWVRIPTLVLPKSQMFNRLFAEFSFEAETKNKLINGVQQLWTALANSKDLPPADPDDMDLKCAERVGEVQAKMEPDFVRDGGITLGFTLAMVLLACWKFSRTDF